MLPSVSRAVALNDEPLAGRYINQALRFAVLLYVPVCLVFMSQPDEIMGWIYSKDFSGGGVILSLLVGAEGIRLVHGILGTALVAAGEARKAAIVIIVSLIPALAILIFFINIWGGIGAALGSALIAVMSTAILGFLVYRRFGAFINKRSAWNIALAGCLMLLVFTLLSNLELFFFLPCVGGLATYFISLIAFREITRQDFAAFAPWMRVGSYEVSNR
jgi:O-antigen/teichoic acid export membrane protein